jgi:hypothetical protein
MASALAFVDTNGMEQVNRGTFPDSPLSYGDPNFHHTTGVP